MQEAIILNLAYEKTNFVKECESKIYHHALLAFINRLITKTKAQHSSKSLELFVILKEFCYFYLDGSHTIIIGKR